LFVADTGNNRVRVLHRDGAGLLAGDSVLETILGDGTASSSGNGAPARAFSVAKPRGLARDALGNLFVAGASSIRVVTAGPNGAASGDSAAITIYGAPPRTTFPQVETSCLSGISVSGARGEQVTFLDACLGLMLRLARTP
jgi:hypothetical protein